MIQAVIKDPEGFTVAYGIYGADAQLVTDDGGVVTVDLTHVIALGVRSLRLALALGPTRVDVEHALERQCGPLPFTCPTCDRTSYHPADKQHGYCGNCHAHTGDPTP